MCGGSTWTFWAGSSGRRRWRHDYDGATTSSRVPLDGASDAVVGHARTHPWSTLCVVSRPAVSSHQPFSLGQIAHVVARCVPEEVRRA